MNCRASHLGTMREMKASLIFSCFLSFLAHSAVSADHDKTPKPLCWTDFETPDELGLYKQLVRNQFLEISDGQGVEDSVALRATYCGYPRGSQRILTRFKLPRKLDEATLVFDVKFDKAFQFLKGGKLHGLGPDKAITGGKKMQPDGWSARAMWRPKGLGSYVYCQNKEGKHGQGPDDINEHEFKTGRYYSLSYHVRLNDPVDEANGFIRIYIDGKLVSEDRDIMFRSIDNEQSKITTLMFSTFHGGQDPSWAPKDENGDYTEVYSYFDNFAVYEGLHIRRTPGER